MNNLGIRSIVGVGAAVIGLFLALAMLLNFEKPYIQTVQHGPRGVALGVVYNDTTLARNAAANQIPAYLPQLPPVGPKASAVYKNVQVLGDLSVGQFTRLMASITQWVAPQQGCNYCHNPANMAEDAIYTKVVARRMLQMTQNINQNWTTHVQATGVTCYTCHRGLNIPSNLWVNQTPPVGTSTGMGMAEVDAGKNLVSQAAVIASLPVDPFTPFLEQAQQIRVQSTTALPADNRASIKQTDWTYALMMHMAQSLGVNCTYCHNSRSWQSWEQSSPQRVSAWYGIRMVREMNVGYMDGLGPVFPAYRKGPMGDVAKVNCTTCHQGIYKPLYGVSMVKDFPELQKISSATGGGPIAP